MYEFWYDYVKPKYDEKAKLCYMDKNSFIVSIKADTIYKDFAEDLKLDLILQIMNYNAIPLIDHHQKRKIKK